VKIVPFDPSLLFRFRRKTNVSLNSPPRLHPFNLKKLYTSANWSIPKTKSILTKALNIPPPHFCLRLSLSALSPTLYLNCPTHPLLAFHSSSHCYLFLILFPMRPYITSAHFAMEFGEGLFCSSFRTLSGVARPSPCARETNNILRPHHQNCSVWSEK